ncbi:DUF4148 domain-containing protein [Kerstersia gyiorum]|jgi:hypothetical protein|uniref:Uncharacterized protein DUF4148 n=1 Tax=Kerstersia gyiorum TaxID=206506 RepID=A0A4Q7MNQ5_9BURK|nr:DUF4148 domain-containing protein [Kerstersia gyiorum]MCO7636436.1 DUF4148 domain-containing protein [Pseudomonas sp. S 311-6]MCH4272897.1 DUF4148 domain-containing protein [Kerstersia gyiorum]MCI1229569.1 DUF4148 domain-containing protein [Kerstersia gyiorum]MCP1634847.1 hypothetical protein [Kerstersia gyiorum]MCP1636879.1 hypothetical protein [Kerstersia gyiorum]
MKALKNTLSFALVAVSVAGAATVHAATDNPNALPPLNVGTPLSSQQVQAELAEARAAGLTDVRPNDLPRLQVGAPLSSAQVQQELLRARAAGEIEQVIN